MRSLFHFPLPCTTTLAVTVSYSNRPTAPEMSHRPHPAPMRRQRRSPVLLSAARPLPGPALTGPWPTVTRSQGARHTAPPSLPHAAARAHRAPSPEYRPAAACSHWARLVRIAPTACRHPHPPMSPPSRSRAHRPPITTIVRRRLTRVALRRPHRAHRAPTSASPPPSLSSRCGGPRALAGKNRAVCIPFSPNARKRPPSWQHPPEMHAFRDQDGNILAPCIHFRVQSGDLGYMARESCRQGPFFASRSPKSRMARRCCQRRPAFLRKQPAVRPNGLCAMRQRHATRGMAERALRPAARAWPACRMRAPCHLARVHRRRLMRVALRRPHRAHRAPPSAAPPIAVGMSCRSGSSCRPRAAHADASRHLRAAPIPPAARTHRVQETSGTTQTTQYGHKNRIPKWGPH